jgi:alkanesulfonate monooxygenase SsuD/methylene tetrahydromethanopterin reductase-like flavin-dependent oxidoreductase (luciferase family)
MITPLSRRRVQKVAREAVTLDHLSNGRLTLGVGLGNADDLGPFGEAVDPRERGRLLDEGLERLGGFWSGDSGRYRCRAHGFPSGSRQPGPIGGRSDGRFDGTGCFRSIFPDQKGLPNSPRRSGKHVPEAMIPST